MKISFKIPLLLLFLSLLARCKEFIGRLEGLGDSHLMKPCLKNSWGSVIPCPLAPPQPTLDLDESQMNLLFVKSRDLGVVCNKSKSILTKTVSSFQIIVLFSAYPLEQKVGNYRLLAKSNHRLYFYTLQSKNLFTFLKGFT